MAKRILLSWIGLDSDFEAIAGAANCRPNLNGPNIAMHMHFEDREYQKHIILYTEDTRSQMRMQTLRDYFKEDNETWPVEFKLVRMPDPDVINIQALQQKMTMLMIELRNVAIDILVTTGTKTMHTVWHLVHLAYKDRTQLIQIRPAQYMDDGRPELLTIHFDASNLPGVAMAVEQSLSHPQPESDAVISDAIKPAYQLAGKVALADRVSALILGKSGSGRELLAKHIHRHSPRQKMPFATVRCASLSDEVLWSELFGHVKGALPGASKERKGWLDYCKGGTVFLDEIGGLSPAMQQALLRVLDEGVVVPLGSDKPHAVDVRLLAATRHNLPEACEAGRFGWDLYYRLAVVELRLPCLAEWSEKDRERLWDHLVARKQAELHKAAPLTLSKEVKVRILQYPFPGNVREMENLVSRLYVVADGRALLHDLPGSLSYEMSGNPWLMEVVEQAHIAKALQFQNYKLTATAKLLGIARNTLTAKCKQYGIPMDSPE